jgi:hypothetical protein
MNENPKLEPELLSVLKHDANPRKITSSESSKRCASMASTVGHRSVEELAAKASPRKDDRLMRVTDLAAEDAADDVLQHNKRRRPSVCLGTLAIERSLALADTGFRLPACISLPRSWSGFHLPASACIPYPRFSVVSYVTGVGFPGFISVFVLT